MKRSKPGILTALCVTGLLAAGAATSATMNTSMGQLPPEQTQGRITYLTGGIGHDEATAMRKEEGRFPLSLEFIRRAKPADEYVADVNVTIKNPKGNTELQAYAAGPYLLAKLPDGKYTVNADLNGKSRTREIVIAAHKPEHVVFEW